MIRTVLLITFSILLTLSIACGRGEDESAVTEIPATDLMVAQATLTAYYIDAAIRAGMTEQEINVALGRIASATVIDEFWVSDENGEVEFCSTDSQGFRFPLDADTDSQAAPFAALLKGRTSIVVQAPRPRELDDRVFQYVGVAGVDKPRIVQVGVEFDESKVTASLEGREILLD